MFEDNYLWRMEAQSFEKLFPDDVLFTILKHVPPTSLIGQCQLVNKRWNHIISTKMNTIWGPIVERMMDAKLLLPVPTHWTAFQIVARHGFCNAIGSKRMWKVFCGMPLSVLMDMASNNFFGHIANQFGYNATRIIRRPRIVGTRTRRKCRSQKTQTTSGNWRFIGASEIQIVSGWGIHPGDC